MLNTYWLKSNNLLTKYLQGNAIDNSKALFAFRRINTSSLKCVGVGAHGGGGCSLKKFKTTLSRVLRSVTIYC